MLLPICCWLRWVVCVGEFGGVFWLGVLLRFAQGDGGGLLCLFSVFRYAEYPYGLRWVVGCCGLLGR